MRIFLLTLVMISLASSSKGQSYNTDSLLQVIRSSKDVGTRLDAANYYFRNYESQGTDSMYYAGEQMLKIGQKLKYVDMQIYAKSFIGFCHLVNGETYKALSLSIEALKLVEQNPNDELFNIVYADLGNVYSSVNLKKSIQFTKKALAIAERSIRPEASVGKAVLLSNLSNRYVASKQYDSALVFANRSFEIIMQKPDTTVSYAMLYYTLGRINLLLNNTAVSYSYKQLALQKARLFKHPREINQALVGMGDYHFHTANPDSALFYYQQYYSLLKQNKAKISTAEPALPMYKIFKAKGAETEALYYLEAYHDAKAKADSTKQIQLTQALSFEEDMRQQELANVEALAAEERKHNLQFTAIGIGLVTLIILFLLLSHSVIANKKLIRFMGMIALLVVFEFFNLLLHPLLGKITHHSPILMLLAMVSLAAILIPFHHKVEHWITHKMVEKNNKIRLAAAKKVIEQLEVKSTPTIPV